VQWVISANIREYMLPFPTMCIDNFYLEPDKVREFALAQEFTASPTGQWPGKRTKDIFLLDPEFMSKFCHKIFSYYFDLQYSKLRWKVTSSFQLIDAYDTDVSSSKNKGWIHYDDALFGGIIYLNKSPNINSGTSLYEIIDPSKYDKEHRAKHFFYLNQTYNKNYETEMTQQDSNFIETVRFSNRYNRMISFDSGVPHRADNFSMDSEPRLTQVFFVEEIESNRPRSAELISTV
jgi:hypothetical protein